MIDNGDDVLLMVNKNRGFVEVLLTFRGDDVFFMVNQNLRYC